MSARPYRVTDKAALSEIASAQSARTAKAWQHNHTYDLALVCETNERPQGAFLVSKATEPYTGGRQVKLEHFLGLDPSSVDRFQVLLNYLHERYLKGSGWLAVSGYPDSSSIRLAEICGFETAQLDLERELKKPFLTRPNSVERAEPVEFTFIAELSQQTGNEMLCYPPGVEPMTVQEFCKTRWPTLARSLDVKHDDVLPLVARDHAKTLQGYLILDFSAQEAWINDLAVAPSYRGGRVARSLLESARLESTKRAFQILKSTVSSSNPRSWKPAIRAGFQVTSKRLLKRYELPPDAP